MASNESTVQMYHTPLSGSDHSYMVNHISYARVYPIIEFGKIVTANGIPYVVHSLSGWENPAYLFLIIEPEQIHLHIPPLWGIAESHIFKDRFHFFLFLFLSYAFIILYLSTIAREIFGFFKI